MNDRVNCLQCGHELPPMQQFCDQCGAPTVPTFSAPPVEDEHTPSTWRVTRADVERAQSAGPMLKAGPTHLMPEPPLLRADKTRHMEPCPNHPQVQAERTCAQCAARWCEACMPGPTCEGCGRQSLWQRVVGWLRRLKKRGG
ncbi:MAG: hypothetical protein ACYCW6_11180 [Candidatus Xenobia bacterium]